MPSEKEITEDELQLPQLRIIQTCPIDSGECKKKEEIEKEFNPSQVFLDIPYTGYNKEYEEAIREAIESFGLIPILAETSAKAEGLLCNVCKTIQKSGYAVADISGVNKNVPYELGIIHSLGIKVCILCDSDTKIPVDLAGLIINKYYDKGDLKKHVSKWITGNVEEIAIKIAQQRKIFGYISYQLNNKNLNKIEEKIDEIKEIGDLIYLINESNQLIDKLIYFLKNYKPETRWKAATILGMIGSDRATEALIVALKDEITVVRCEVAIALGEIGDIRSVEPLIAILKEHNFDLRKSAEKALVKIGEGAVEPLIATLSNENSKVKKEVASILGKIGDSRAVDPLLDTLKFDGYYLHLDVTRALGEIGDTRAVEPLIAVLGDMKSDFRPIAAEALGLIGDERAIEPLIVALSDDDRLRSSAAKALGEIGDTRAIEHLITALNDDNQYVRSSTAKALGIIGDVRAFKPLIATLEDENPYVRNSAAKALESIDNERATKILGAGYVAKYPTPKFSKY